MKESEVRAKMRELKGDLLRMECDEHTGKVTHFEIHRDSRLILNWPKGSRTRIKPQECKSYGPDWKQFSLSRKDYDLSSLEWDIVV